jgi:hypothetical protein
MAITIRHLEGPLVGHEQHFDDSVEVITFGRSAECDVVYPLECVEIGRKHFQLRRLASCNYVVSLFENRFVEIDGVIPEDGAVVKHDSVIRLGRPDGPCFRVNLGREMQEIAWSSEEAYSDLADYLSPDPIEEQQDRLADLFLTRKSQAPAVIAGITASPIGGPLQPMMPPVSSPVPSPSSPDRNSTVEAAPSGPPYNAEASHAPLSGGLSTGKAQSRIAEPRRRKASSLPRRVGSSESQRDLSLGRVPQISDTPSNSAPQMRMRSRRVGALWWVAAALAAAALAYFLYRREIPFGAIFGKLFQAAIPPPAPKATSMDLVEASVFGPNAVEAGQQGLIQVLLHQLNQREIAKALAQENDPDATRRGIQTLAAEIARGQRVEIILEGRGLDVDQEMQPLVWRGEPCACQFTVTAPKHLAGKTVHPRALVLVDSVPVGSLTFALKVTASKQKAREAELRGDRARRYSYAFLSYASPDRAEVIKRAQGLKAGGTSFFNDLLSLEPGERWEKRLYQEIDSCDVFYLFWSSQAKASEWVMKETEYALARRAASEDGAPDIIPVIIEGPPSPSPPDSLKDIHFDDCLFYVLAGIDGQRAGGGAGP